MSDEIKDVGIEPATGARAEALAELSRLASDLIRVIDLERSGVRDGDGSWRGRNALDNANDNLVAACLLLPDDAETEDAKRRGEEACALLAKFARGG